MFEGVLCRACEKFSFCSKARKFLVTHGFKLENFIDFQIVGLREMYGSSIVEKAMKLMDRFRRFFGYKYVFKNDGVSVYLRKKDIKTKINIFKFNEDNKFFEYDNKMLERKDTQK